MPKPTFFLIIIILFFGCQKEKDESPSGFDTFYDLHANDKNVIAIGMPKFIFKMFIHSPNKEIEHAIDAIETIDLLIINEPGDSLMTELYAQFPIKYYKPVISFNNSDGKIKFLVREKRRKADELIMIALQQTEHICALMRIGGSFNLKTLEKLAEQIDVNEIVKYR
jgi:hypothetical protein